MNNKQTETRLKQTFSIAAPDDLDSVLRRCEEEERVILPLPQKRKKAAALPRLAAMAAACLLVAGLAWNDSRAVASTVSLDVNPSIQIEANRREKVLRVTPLNEEGETVVGGMDFSGAGLDVTVNALIGSMLRCGYLSEAANAILISVDDSDPTRGARLQQQLSAEIDQLLQSGGLSPAVLSHNYSSDPALDMLADAYNITTGKARLVQQMATQNTFYSEEQLAALPINDLSLLNSNVDNVSYTGQASDSAYIGKAAALQAALDHANLTAADLTFSRVEMDFDDGKMLYEVEFFTMLGEFEYEIDARTGAVLDWPAFEIERQETTPAPSKTEQDETLITPEAAFGNALIHAGLAQYSVHFGMEWELDKDHGIPVYEITFSYTDLMYEYVVDARTGAVLKYQRMTRCLSSGTGLGGANTPLPYVPPDGAKLAALSHAGLTEEQIADYVWETEEENGRTVYEISFKAGDWEYEYEIHGSTGAVLKYEKEWNDR